MLAVAAGLNPSLHASSDDFGSIPSGDDNVATASILNMDKNRYSDIFAPDSTRVLLSDNNYINANWIDENTIATQGPLHDTVSDFWQMVIEHNIDLVVMLTCLEENARKKCDKYWADVGKGLLLGLYYIYTKSEKQENGLIIRDIEIRLDNMVILSVTQISFPDWKDGQVPDYKKFSNLVSFIRDKKSKMVIPTSMTVNNDLKVVIHSLRMVIHCSAGIGRTGVLCAILRFFETGESAKKLVLELRKKRPGMVQTRQQYKFLKEYIRIENSF